MAIFLEIHSPFTRADGLANWPWAHIIFETNSMIFYSFFRRILILGNKQDFDILFSSWI